MKSLADRHAERAQRKADNMAESTLVNTGTNGNVGRVANMIADTTAALRGLSEAERDELKAAMGEGFDADADGYRSIAEDDTGGLSMAGIGVPNPFVTPPAAFMDAAHQGASNGELPAASFDPTQGNLNGQAVDAAGTPASAGWGTPGGAGAGQAGNGAGGDGYSALTVAELKTKLDAAGVSYTSSANKDALIDLLRANDKTSASQGGDNS